MWRLIRIACIALVIGLTGQGMSQPALDELAAPAATPAGQPLRVVLFHSPICSACREVLKNLPDLTKPFGGQIVVEQRSVGDKEGLNEFYQYCEHYKSGDQAVPIIFVGKQWLVTDKQIISKLGEAIKTELKNGSATYDPKTATSQPAGHVSADGADPPPVAAAAVPDKFVQRFQGFNVGAVVAAGLIDGVNPCAFATIVFLLSMLAMVGKSRRQLAMVGVSFTATVFVTYTLLGLGMLTAIKVFSINQGFNLVIGYGVAGLAFALAGWTLVDVFRYRRSGDTRDMTLQLPKAVKTRIHKVIHVGLGWRSLMLGTVVTGFLVTLLESVCTGQVYLPTIVLVWRVPGMRANALAYLLLYNLMFTLPLALVMILAYFGVKSDRFARLFKQNLLAVKLCLAGLFLGLGVLMLFTM